MTRTTARIEFEFPGATTPSTVSDSTDNRLLGGSFTELVQSAEPSWESFASVQRWQHPRQRPVLPLFSLDDEQVTWKGEELLRLLLRCGSGSAASDASVNDVRKAVADAALDVEWRSEEEFVDFVYRLLFTRGADRSAQATYGSRLRAGVTRERVINWIMRGEEFRSRYVAR
jgi:hypothetical protein